jgi:hypothetical protein
MHGMAPDPDPGDKLIMDPPDVDPQHVSRKNTSVQDPHRIGSID